MSIENVDKRVVQNTEKFKREQAAWKNAAGDAENHSVLPYALMIGLKARYDSLDPEGKVSSDIDRAQEQLLREGLAKRRRAKSAVHGRPYLARQVFDDSVDSSTTASLNSESLRKLREYTLPEKWLEMDPDALFSSLETILTPHYVFVNETLINSGARQTGFNDHSMVHITMVYRKLKEMYDDVIQHHSPARLERQTGLPVKHLKNALILILFGHDLANAYHRKGHATNSIFMITEIFPELNDESNKALLQLIFDTIYLHSQENMRNFATNGDKRAPQKSRAHRLSSAVIPALFAVLDERDLGSSRICSIIENKEQVVKDEYAALCLLLQDKSMRFNESKQTVHWRLEFTRDVEDEQYTHLSFPKEIKNEGAATKVRYRSPVPNEWGQNVSLIENTWAHYWAKFRSNLLVQIDNIFAIYPTARTLDIEVNNVGHAKESDPRQLLCRFHRHSVDQDIQGVDRIVDDLLNGKQRRIGRRARYQVHVAEQELAQVR